MKISIPTTAAEETRQRVRELLDLMHVPAVVDLAWKRLRPRIPARRLADKDKNILGLWADVRGIAPWHALLEVLCACDLISAAEHDHLIAEIDSNARTCSGKPSWCRDTGELSFNGRVVRRLQMRTSPTALVQIIAAFEAANWPTAIPNPLELDANLDLEVLRLNCLLQDIEFFVCARQVCWRPMKVLREKRKKRTIAKK